MQDRRAWPAMATPMMAAGLCLCIPAALAAQSPVASTLPTATAAAAASRPASLEELPPPKCPPLIRGALWWIHPATDGPRLNELLDAMEAVGFNLLWVFGTDPLLEDPKSDLLEQIYRQADRRGWRVIIETSSPGQWWAPIELDKLKAMERDRIARVSQRLAAHPSFWGWYINYEIYMEWGQKSEQIRELYAYIGRLVREHTPGKKLTISPFFLADQWRIRGDFRYASPQEYGQWWTETIRTAGIDVVMLQDSGAEHCECVPLHTRAAFFEAMARACRANGAELWGNVETVEQPAADWAEYARRYREHQQSGTPYPWVFDMQRIAWKLDVASRYSTNLVTWGWGFWNPVTPHSADLNTARARYEAYRAYVRSRTGKQQ